MNFFEQLSYNLQPGEHYESAAELVLSDPKVKLIAFYLPQFHPIPENDGWWGKGFTEWTNVTKAIPRFAGHYQPHLPSEMGFYDLRLPAALKAQAALARKFSIHGFCFHYYWFGGRRLLETPLNILLSNPDIDLQFCINWANESWTRRWDGTEDEVLMGQRYSEEDDIEFAAALEPIVRDPRYIRIEGRPLIMLYRPRLLPDAAATVSRWRQKFELLGLQNPYVVMVQSFGEKDPRPFGMDAAVGFPPHGCNLIPPDNGAVHPYANEFQNQLFSYDEMVQSASEMDPSEYMWFPGICPGWDNEARRPTRGLCLVGSSPRKYGEWLDNACRKVMRRSRQAERLVFVNAWNEWAEGAHLEPDRHFGYAYLNETVRVLNDLTSTRPANNGENPISRPAARSSVKRRFRKVARKTATALEWMAFILRQV